MIGTESLMSFWREADSMICAKPGHIFMKQSASTSVQFINISGFFSQLREFLSTFIWISHYSPITLQPQEMGLLRAPNLCLFITSIITATCKHTLSCQRGLSSLPAAFSPSSFLVSVPPVCNLHYTSAQKVTVCGDLQPKEILKIICWLTQQVRTSWKKLLK